MAMIPLAFALGIAAQCQPVAPTGMVMRAAPFGWVIAPTIAEAAEGEVAGLTAKSAAERVLALKVPPFLIAPPSAASSCALTIPWSFAPVRADLGTTRPPTHVLLHEIGHTLFIHFVIPSTRPDQYGGDAPDWLDEMAALAFEDLSAAPMRRAEARRHAEVGKLIPLARLLTMPHPEWSARVSVAAEPRTEAGVQQPRSTETPAFYATVWALLEFLTDRAGNERVVSVLAERARSGAPIDEWLLLHAARGEAATGLEALDRQIAAFVLDDARHDARSAAVAGKSD